MVELNLFGHDIIKARAPDTLKPTIHPIRNLLEMASKSEIVWVVVFSDFCKRIDVRQMNKRGHWIFDSFKRQYYMCQHQSITLKICIDSKGVNTLADAWLISEDAATTVELGDAVDKPEKLRTIYVDGIEVSRVNIANDILGFDVSRATLPEALTRELKDIESYQYGGSTLKVIPSECLKELIADPDNWAAFIDNHDMSDMFSAQSVLGMIIIVFCVAFIVGGLFMGPVWGILGHMILSGPLLW